MPQLPQSIIGMNVEDLKKQGVEVKDFNPIGMTVAEAQAAYTKSRVDTARAKQAANPDVQRQAKTHPTRQKVGIDDPMLEKDGWAVAADQAVSNVEGAANFIPGLLKTGAGLLKASTSPLELLAYGKNMISGVVTPAKTLGRNAISLGEALGPKFYDPNGSVFTTTAPPTTAENREMAEASGANAAATALLGIVPETSGVIREGGPTSAVLDKTAKARAWASERLTPTAEGIMGRSQTNRLAGSVTLEDIAAAKTSRLSAVKLVKKLYGRMAAPVQEEIALRMVADTGPIETLLNRVVGSHPEVGASQYEAAKLTSNARRASGGSKVESAPKRGVEDQYRPQPADRVPPPTAPPVGVEYPVSRDRMGQTTDSFLDPLRQAETPEQIYAREQARRNVEFEPDADSPKPPPIAERPTVSRDSMGQDLADLPMDSTPPPSAAPELNKWMGVNEKQLRYGNNPAEQIIKDKLLGPDKVSTLENVTKARKAIGAEMETAFTAAEDGGARFDMSSEISDVITDAKKTIGKSSDEAFMKAIEGIENDIADRTRDLKSMTPREAHALEKEISKGINFESNAAHASDVTRVLKEIRKRISKQLKTVEGLGALKDRWGNLFEAEKSLETSIRQNQVGRGTPAPPPGYAPGAPPR